MGKYCKAGQDTDDNMAHAHCIPDTQGYKHTHSKYVTLIAFPLQQWLHKGASLLRCTYIACPILYLNKAAEIKKKLANKLYVACFSFIFKVFFTQHVFLRPPTSCDMRTHSSRIHALKGWAISPYHITIYFAHDARSQEPKAIYYIVVIVIIIVLVIVIDSL